MINENFCPVCETNGLVSQSHAREVAYKSHRKILNTFLRSNCQNCGSVVVNSEQSKHNKRIILAFQKEAEGLLTGVEVKNIRIRLGLSQLQASRVFGGGPVAFSKYENNDVVQSESMDKLLRVALSSKEALVYLAKEANIEVKYESTQIRKVAKTHNVFEFLDRLDATAVPDSPVFVRVNSSKTSIQMNDAYYHEAQSATG